MINSIPFRCAVDDREVSRGILRAVKRASDRAGQITRLMKRLQRLYPDATRWEVSTRANPLMPRARAS
jgi:hypothetical protein